MGRSLYFDSALITEQNGEVYFDNGSVIDTSSVNFKPGPTSTPTVWIKAITLVIPNGSNNLDIGTFIDANNPNDATNITLKVESGSIVGRLNFYSNIPSNYYVELYNYGNIQGSKGTYGVSGGLGIHLARPVKVINNGVISGGGGCGGDGGDAAAVAPSYISNFAASDTLTNKIQVTFSASSGVPTPRYDLYQGSTRLAYNITSGYNYSTTSNTNRLLHIKAINSAGTTSSNTNYGRPYLVPGYVSNFNASDGYTGYVDTTFTGTSGYPSPTYNLYENGTKVKTGTWNGYDRAVSAGTRSYYVKAVNAAGSTNSNSNNGTSKPAPGAVSFSTSSTWLCPAGVTLVNLKMIGGGGGGGIDFTYHPSIAAPLTGIAGGGHRGAARNQNVSVSPGTTYTITIGGGGSRGYSKDTGSGSGGAGGTSSALGLSCAGGGGGSGWGSSYAGNGGSYVSPVGTYYDGILKYTEILYEHHGHYGGGYGGTNKYYAYGGDAGFGYGGAGVYVATRNGGQKGLNGGYGAGGGSVTVTDSTGDCYAGYGGGGYVRISW